MAAVDWVRSIPLAVAEIDGAWTIDDQADRLRRRAGLSGEDINLDVAREIAMAGYGIDNRSLYNGLHVLGPGELMWFEENKEPRRTRYYTYQPWKTGERADPPTENDLADCTLGLIQRLLQSLDGRPLVVPLSAGYDSRLIVSAARHLGARNVQCFSYGRADNHEAKVAEAVAERLGYQWKFVPCTTGELRRFFNGEEYSAYLRFADSCTSVPFVQDMFAIKKLQEEGYIPPEAVIANGNSGDFISGGHIAPVLRETPRGMTEAERRERILSALYDKHFALWGALRSEENRDHIIDSLLDSLSHADALIREPEHDHGLYEYVEFQDRQCKYVITGQRIYEFLGHDWRLPLWENPYLRFWETVPLSDKTGQFLYARTLENSNWGGVWDDIPVNRLTVRPSWIIPLRWLFKLLHVPLGKRRWHRFERQYFQYWMDITCNSACEPYTKVAKDRRGSRQSVSWLAEQYLVRHGVSLDAFVSG